MRYTLTRRCSHTELFSAANPLPWLVIMPLSPALIGQWPHYLLISVVAGDVSYPPISAQISLVRRGWISGPCAASPTPSLIDLYSPSTPGGEGSCFAESFWAMMRELQTYLPVCSHHRHKLVFWAAPAPACLAAGWGWLGIKNSWQRLLVLRVMQCWAVTTHGGDGGHVTHRWGHHQAVSRWGGVWCMSQGTCPSQQTSPSSVSSLLNFWLTADMFLIFEPSAPGSDWVIYLDIIFCNHQAARAAGPKNPRW